MRTCAGTKKKERPLLHSAGEYTSGFATLIPASEPLSLPQLARHFHHYIYAAASDSLANFKRHLSPLSVLEAHRLHGIPMASAAEERAAVRATSTPRISWPVAATRPSAQLSQRLPSGVDL